ncbi:lysylphosphatidylglycerol synthase domain-containing protein [Streptomyces sp. NPDC046831]|uniref:lysylphosphatidylglycerol synthase domain-containing protein n=1 Tax=Streptomyces sp. NPDC046831 TaxID=3154805 RepID=UPI0033FCFD95
MTVTEAAPQTRAAGRGAGRTVLSAVFFLAASAGLWLSLRGRIGEFADLALRPGSLPWLAAAFAANGVGVLISLVTWRALLTGLGPPVGLPAAARIYFTSFLGKFVPGRVWGLLAQLRLGRAAGFSHSVMTGVFLLNLAVGTLTGLALGLVCGPALLGGRTWWLLLPAGLLAVWIARPGLLDTALRAAARVARRRPPEATATDAGMRRGIAAALGSWLVSGLHLWLLAVLFGADAPRALPLCVGGFALATALSSLAIVLPDGWGAREAILMLALSDVLPWPTAGAVAVTSRVVCTASEVAVAGGALLYARRRARRAAGPSSSHPSPAPQKNSRTGEQ